jgi:hypothetical protein
MIHSPPGGGVLINHYGARGASGRVIGAQDEGGLVVARRGGWGQAVRSACLPLSERNARWGPIAGAR